MAYLPPGYPQEQRDQLERWGRQVETTLSKAAKELSPNLSVDVTTLRSALDRIHWEYGHRLIEAESIEKAPEAHDGLKKMAKKASALAEAIRELGAGAVWVMNKPTVRQELIPDAEPFNLPDKDPWGPGFTAGIPDEESDRLLDEWARGGRWIVRLEALAELALVKADRIKEEARKGGAKSFATRLSGESLTDGLALACRDFAKAHGCQSQAVVLRMVQAILEAQHGPQGVRKAGSRKQEANEKGRAAVRKVTAQKLV